MSVIEPCPCGLSKDAVLYLDQHHHVQLIEGQCQNSLVDGSLRVCGIALSAHPHTQVETDEGWFACLMFNLPPTPVATTALSHIIAKEITEVFLHKMHARLNQLKYLERNVVTLIPSEACLSIEENSHFVNLMELLGFKRTGNLMDVSFLFNDNFNFGLSDQPFIVDWVNIDDSYCHDIVTDWLNEKGYNALNVSNGADLPHGQLYNVKIYEPLSCDMFPMALRYQLGGRTDIIVMKRKHRNNRMKMKFFINIKRVTDMETDSQIQLSLREAFLQLLGMNSYNPYCSPPGVLTNLQNKNFVLYFAYDDEDEEYKLMIIECKSFDRAVDLADEMSNRPSCTNNLGVGNAPPQVYKNDNVSQVTLIPYVERISSLEEKKGNITSAL
eukprot:gene15397-20766_t